ncbi:hypothetical protein GOV04_01450 [Candidatus Woesearchaeota archaeon]|nr:hypothetical protein [Candidatus Woesearchaeota archaeon]
MREVVGLVEKIVIFGVTQKSVNAKIDTGAVRSSICQSLVTELKLGPVNRVKVYKSALGKQQRPLIRIKIKIKNNVLTEEFSVSKRENLTTPVLIGQNILKKASFIIDPLK